MKTVRCAICSLGFVAALAVTQTVFGTIIVSHSGATDPTTEGWVLGYRANAVVGAVSNDSGLGVDAWKTIDTGTASGSDLAQYKGDTSLTSGALAEIATGGWAFRANLRVDDLMTSGFNESLDLAPGLQVALAGQEWVILQLGQDGSGNTTARVKAGAGLLTASSVITISGAGYHDFELVNRPATSLVDLYVDGTKMVDGINASYPAQSSNVLLWGVGDTPGIGAGYWNSVQFETAPSPIPEPTSLVLCGCSLVGLLAYAWRKMK